MLLTPALLSSLTAQAQASPRLRQHYDLRDSEDDTSQRMLNAIEPGTEIPVYRHPDTSEDVIVLRGIAEEVLYDDNGQETARHRLVAGGNTRGSMSSKDNGTPCAACRSSLLSSKAKTRNTTRKGWRYENKNTG